MKKNLKKIVAISIIGAFILIASAVLADSVVWKWIDDKGNVHYSEYLDQVPEKYRDKAVKVVIKDSDGSNSGSSHSTPKKDTVKEDDSEKKMEAQIKAYEGKAKTALKQIASIEASTSAKQNQCNELRRKSVLASTIANRQASEKCFKELEDMERQLEKAREYLATGIYAEAHKAGVAAAVVDEAIRRAKSGK